MLESVEEFADWGPLKAARIACHKRKSEAYAITDIGMRIFAPRDLARARRLADGYILDAVVNDKPDTKTVHVRLIGNTMRPAVASLVRGNVAGFVERAAA